MMKNVFLIVGILSIIVLGVVIFYRPQNVPQNAETVQRTPEEQLEWFMGDKMNYDVRFSRLLAERRLEAAEEIAREHPELSARAREVIDSLRARLDRRAQM